MNRVTAAIDKVSIRLRASGLPQSRIEEISRKLDMDLAEFALFQERKSMAFASGKLTLDEAQTVYGLLGNSPGQFNRHSLAVKVTLTRLFAELLA